MERIYAHAVNATTTTTTIQLGRSDKEFLEALQLVLAEHRGVLLPQPAEFTAREREVARHASSSQDAFVKANAEIVLGRPEEAREALARGATQSQRKASLADGLLEPKGALDNAKEAKGLVPSGDAFKPVFHMSGDAFRYFTAMGDTFYFEQRFDDAAVWYEQARQTAGHERDVKAMGIGR